MFIQSLVLEIKETFMSSEHNFNGTFWSAFCRLAELSNW